MITLKLLTLDEAVKAVMKKKSFGAHIFYYPDEDLKNYHGYIQDEKASRSKGRPAVIWSVSNLVQRACLT